MRIDGTDLSTLGWHPGPRRWPELGAQRRLQQIAGRPGGFLSGSVIPAATMETPGTLVAATRADLLAATQSLLALLRPGAATPRTVTFADTPGWEWSGYVDAGLTVGDEGPGYLSRVRTVSVRWVLPEPFARATSETTAAIADGTPVALPLASAPTPLRLELVPTDSVTVEVQTASGEVLARLAWQTPDLPDGTPRPTPAALVIDADDCAVRSGDGTILSDGLLAGYQMPVAVPADGAARLVVTGATGTVRYRQRAWMV